MSETGLAGSNGRDPEAAQSREVRPLRLPPLASWLIAAAAGAVVGHYLWSTEATTLTLIHAATLCLGIAGLVCGLTRRLLPGVIAATAFVALVIGLTTAKSRETDMLLHGYDLVLALGSPSRLAGLVAGYPGQVLALVLAAAATFFLIRLTRRADRVVVGRRIGLAVGAVLLAGSVLAARVGDSRPHTLYYFWNVHLSAFSLSLAETVEVLLRRSLIMASPADAATGPRLTIPAACKPEAKPPHVLLIHQESVVPPALFPGLGYDKRTDTLFRSFDGRSRRLRVETYGGGSWLTEFSVLTGLSVQSFGGMRQLVQPVLAGKVRDTLPEALARCGYRNVLLYPMLRTYTGAGRFFPAVGIREIRDAKDQKAGKHNERDRFYYANALDEIARHRTASDQPLFLYIQTSAAHWPYTVTYAPELDVAGGAAGTNPEMHEYLRRLSLANIDYGELKDALARRFPAEQFLIVHYGDHQPTATRTLLGFPESADIEDITRANPPAAYLAYYAIDAVGYVPPADSLPVQETTDVAYLGAVLLEAAGLPLSDAYRERRRLMALCGGRYFDCPDREAILRFHRRLIEAGLIDAF